ncbi:ATP-dependent Clp endopeptidase, proteolytic subunit ClpP [Lachnospiraceae bacterium 3-1]|nr:ATP-dependent Clp endopeptidase, proteolytic subunit ClpP [Lachnospiraceae bacterium 3-1]
MTERILELNGTIAEESWFDDDVTPQLFKDELNSGTGDITVWINSPGGDCVAAAQIYNMLSNYKGKVTVKIDGIAASAASVIAMAGDTVLVSPVSMLMIHNPATIAWGDHAEMQKAIDMLSEVKESIINAYVLKTGLSRPKLSHLMDAETWMDANKAVELGFADEIMTRAKAEPEKEPEEDTEGGASEEDEEEKKFPPSTSSMLFSRRAANNALLNKLAAKYGGEKPKADIQAQAKIPAAGTETGRSVDALMERLNLLKR